MYFYSNLIFLTIDTNFSETRKTVQKICLDINYIAVFIPITDSHRIPKEQKVNFTVIMLVGNNMKQT